MIFIKAFTLQPWIDYRYMKRYLVLTFLALSLGGTLALGLSVGVASPVLAGSRIG